MRRRPNAPRAPRVLRPLALLAPVAGTLAGTIAVACVALAPRVARAQRLVVRPDTVVRAGDPLDVSVDGLAPGARVVLTAERLAAAAPGAPNVLRAAAVLRADRTGRVRLADAAPLAGTWTGADAAGPFWSMALAPTSVDTAGRGLGPGRVRLVARAVPDAVGDSLAVAQAHDAPVGAPALAVASVTLRARDPRVVVDSIPDFPGAVYARLADAPGASPVRRPVLIVLGGSEGGASTARAFAPRFASHGYAVVGLPYYSPGWGGGREIPALPADFVDIPVDRLDAVRAWLAARADVDTARIGIWGASKGAEYALLAASYFPWVKAVAAIVPSDVVWEGWGAGAGEGRASSFAWRGTALPFVPYDSMQAEFAAARREQRPVRLVGPHARGRARFPARAAAARIPVERFRGALLVAGGGRDEVWPSAEMATAIAATRRAAGLPTERLVFPDAGHALPGDGWSPIMSQVGTAAEGAALARARQATWTATLALFARTLRPPTVPALAAAAAPNFTGR